MKPEISEKVRKIKLLVLDVDGVLTNGSIYLPGEGEEIKVFHVRDGSALVRARQHGLNVVWLSGRKAKAVSRRAEELGVDGLYQGIENKTGVVEELTDRYSCRPDEVAYMGDDLSDLPIFQEVGFSATVADAPPAVRKTVDYVSRREGGAGAVAELVDLILETRVPLV